MIVKPLDIQDYRNEEANDPSSYFSDCCEKLDYMDRLSLCLANNPNTAANILEVLSFNSECIVIEAVASNENTEASTLKRLANHEEPAVRAAVAQNKYVPFETLERLSDDEHPDVRFATAENPFVPQSILAKLTEDENPYVGLRAKETLQRLEKERSTRWSSVA